MPAPMNHDTPETIPPVWQIGDVILDRYEVRQVFTSGGHGAGLSRPSSWLEHGPRREITKAGVPANRAANRELRARSGDVGESRQRSLAAVRVRADKLTAMTLHIEMSESIAAHTACAAGCARRV